MIFEKVRKATTEVVKRFFTFIHPVLLISLILFAAAEYELQGEGGGPCPSPLIVLFAPLEIGIIVGLVMSLGRTVIYLDEKEKAERERRGK